MRNYSFNFICCILVEALFLSKKNVNPFRVRVTINEKRALLSKMYPLSGDRLGVGSFFQYSGGILHIIGEDIFKVF